MHPAKLLAMNNLQDAAHAACIALGINYQPVPQDGNWHTCDLSNDPRGKADGRLKLFVDGQGGIAFNFKTNQQQAFFAHRKIGEPHPVIDPEQREALKKQSEADRQHAQAQAAAKADYIFPRAPFAPSSQPYLTTKNIKPHGAKIALSGALIIPLYNAENYLVNLQFIHASGDKRFLKGGKKQGCFWWLGKLAEPGGTILICEGFATAATLFEATGHLTIIAYDAGNLEAVAKLIRQRQPAAKIILCADNDTSGRGQDAATAAALAVDGYIALPPDPGTDFNDLANNNNRHRDQ
jgi:putative DNA primase/helicase